MKLLTLHRSQSFRGPLILVNRDHPLQEAETPELIRGTIVPVSGWRSFGEQQAIGHDT